MKSNIILQGHIIKDNSIPLYYQLASIIKRGITSGLLKVGDALPSESEICGVYSLSRSTVRQATGALVDEGLLYRRRGQGTFISQPKLIRRLDNLYNFTSDMEHQGLRPTSKILKFEKISYPEDLQKSLEMANEDAQVFRIIRVRMADEIPLLLETTFIPVKFCPKLTGEMLENNSLYKLLKDEAHSNPHYAVEKYEPIIIKSNEAKILNCKSGSTGYFVERTTRIDTWEVMEYTQSIVRGDRCIFEVELFKNNVQFRRIVSGNTNKDEHLGIFSNKG